MPAIMARTGVERQRDAGEMSARSQSGLIDARAMIGFQRFCSWAMKLANSAGVSPTTIAASAVMRLDAAGLRTLFALAAASLSTAAFDIDDGARMPYHWVISNPG